MKVTLKAARVNSGYTQREVADLLDKNVSTIINWENGNGKNINWFDFQRLCKLYNVSTDIIFFKQ
ncbi:helix-turn-helix transcriptional regulator [Gemella haemolysans]|uniref:helix-turn-helix transcriptional regulator n=1 Tax=Gemella haemolysans TaxID=1379 RepID=UPI00232E4CF4|nr:helix-turn-helix transcriptional regulator [Gemella haemolysans]MDB6212472.1 helix-turn-helix transcriptional regulator [Gemella haemolysans]